MTGRSRPIFGDDAFKDLGALNSLPTKEGEIGIVATDDGNVGVTGSVSTPLGKGWSVGAAGEWMRKTGGKVAGLFTWKGGR